MMTPELAPNGAPHSNGYQRPPTELTESWDPSSGDDGQRGDYADYMDMVQGALYPIQRGIEDILKEAELSNPVEYELNISLMELGMQQLNAPCSHRVLYLRFLHKQLEGIQYALRQSPEDGEDEAIVVDREWMSKQGYDAWRIPFDHAEAKVQEERLKAEIGRIQEEIVQARRDYAHYDVSPLIDHLLEAPDKRESPSFTLYLPFFLQQAVLRCAATQHGTRLGHLEAVISQQILEVFNQGKKAVNMPRTRLQRQRVTSQLPGAVREG